MRVASQWLLVLMLAVLLGAFFLFATAYQATSGETADRILRRGIAITTEIDTILPRIETDLEVAAQTAEGDQVTVPNYPVPVQIPKQDVGGIESSELRERILQQSADRLYEDGMSAWAANDPEAQQSIDRFSTPGAMHRPFAMVTEKWNTVFLIAALLFGFLSLVLAALLWVSLVSYLRLLAIGAAISIASISSLALAVAVRFALRTAETEADAFEEQLIDLGVDTVWLFIRNYLILSLLGFVLVAIASVFLWWQARTSPQAAPRAFNTPY
jgi:hypothetical protein